MLLFHFGVRNETWYRKGCCIMKSFKGISLYPGAAFGSASVIRVPNGIPLLPARMVEMLAKSCSDSPLEPMDVILVAQDYEYASAMTFPWAHVVGIVAEHASIEAPLGNVPAIISVPDLLVNIEDGDLLLIDGDHGAIFVNPDGMTIAAYQSDKEHISPKRRFYLDYQDQPAVTIDGREIRVIARINTIDDFEQAQRNGADAFYITAGADLLPFEISDREQLSKLISLAELADGKPITVMGGRNAFDYAALLKVATRAELTLCLPGKYRLKGFNDIQHYMRELSGELISDNYFVSDVRLAAYLRIGDILDDDLTGYPISRIVIDGSDTTEFGDGEKEWIRQVSSICRSMLTPLELIVPFPTASVITQAISLGVSGMIISSEQVPSVKTSIRETDEWGNFNVSYNDAEDESHHPKYVLPEDKKLQP